MDTLQEQMRSLRLPGMASVWETMTETRTSTSLSLADGLKVLLQAERDAHLRNRTARLPKNAGFRYQAAVESVFFDREKGRDRDALMRLATCAYLRSGQSVLVTGPSRTGKSYIASALGVNACLAGHTVLYTGMAKLLERIALARVEGSIARYFDRMATLDLLIIDDFGMRKPVTETPARAVSGRTSRSRSTGVPSTGRCFLKDTTLPSPLTTASSPSPGKRHRDSANTGRDALPQ